MKTAQRKPAAITKKSDRMELLPIEAISKLVVINITPKRLNTMPANFLKLKYSFRSPALNNATQTTLRLTSKEDSEALASTIPRYWNKYARPLMTPENRSRRFLANFKLSRFLVSSIAKTN